MLACLLAIIIIFNMIITNILWERFPNIIMNNTAIITLITVTLNINWLVYPPEEEQETRLFESTSE